MLTSFISRLPSLTSFPSTRLTPHIDQHSAAFIAAQKEISDRCTRLASFLKGNDDAIQRHIARDKLLVRDRINLLLDHGSPFLELSQLAGWECYEGEEVPTSGIITGVGQVCERWCMIIANDATVKGGSYYPITVKKHLRAQQIAEENYLPCLSLVDSGGANLPKQSEVFPDRNHFGRIFYNQARMSSKGIPQLAIVMGSCTAGGAYVPAMSDLSIIVRDTGTVFLAGPPLVKMATGEDISAEDLGGARVHSFISGVTDVMANDDVDAIQILREVVQSLTPQKRQCNCSYPVWEEPLKNPQLLNGLSPIDLRKPADVTSILACLLDGSRFTEFKPHYGKTLITGWGSIYNHSIGVLVNNGILFSESAQKGAHFIELCCQQSIPLVFLQNITGFMVGSEAERSGIAKHGAKLVTAVSCANVPKLTIIIGASFGAGNYGMCGRAYDPRFLFMWPNAKIGVMGGAQAAGVLTQIEKAAAEKKGKPLTVEEVEKREAKICAKYERESDAWYSSARLWDDGVIQPSETRDTLGICLDIVGTAPKLETKFGTFRM